MLILAQGGVAGFIDLPTLGILGNTHLMMQDSNNEVIAGQIIDWIRVHVAAEPAADSDDDAVGDPDRPSD